MQAKLFTFTLAGNTEKLTSHIRESLFFFFFNDKNCTVRYFETIVAHVKYLNFSKQGALTVKKILGWKEPITWIIAHIEFQIKVDCYLPRFCKQCF